MYKNVIVINYIPNVIDFYNYFIITCQLLQTFKSWKFYTFPTMPTVQIKIKIKIKFRLIVNVV